MGIDIGSFESKGVLVDEHGEVVASATRPHRIIVPQPGWAEHRPMEDWWGDTCHISRKLIADAGIDPSSIRALGTSAIGPCMLPVDSIGDPLMNGVLYGVDTRASSQIAELSARIGDDFLLERCGNTLTSQSVGPKMLWLRQSRPEIFERTHKFLTSTSFIVHRLTGRYVIDHHTAAYSIPLYDSTRQGWSTELANDVATIAQLPELGWAGEIAGVVTPTAAGECGLAAGTPVTIGTIDAAAEALSVGVLEGGDMMIMYGSTVFVVLITANRVHDTRLWYSPWLFPGQHASMSGLATSGTLTHWFRKELARELGEDAFAALAAEAADSPPGARGLVVLPHFSGERTPIHDPKAKGAVFGLNLTHTRGDIYRAVLEGIAAGTGQIIDTYADAGQAPRSIQAVGGGVRNAVWTQATSDMTGLTQTVRKRTVGASYGDAFLAALSVGDVPHNAILDWNPVVSVVSPNAANAGVYRHQSRIWRDLYASTKHLMHDLEIP